MKNYISISFLFAYHILIQFEKKIKESNVDCSDTKIKSDMFKILLIGGI